MRYGIIIGIIVGMFGCGDVEVAMDGGDAGSTAGASGTGGGGSGGADCVPDACNTCVNGVKTPAPDGTVCAAPWCSGSATSPFGGTYATTASVPQCQSGACVTVQVYCPQQSCSCANVGYVGCFADPGPAGCRCVSSTGSFCD